MSLSVIKQMVKGHEVWIIADNYRFIETGGIRGSLDRPLRGRYTFDQCWNGKRWTCQVGFAIQFITEEVARQYLKENYELICSAPDAF